MNKTPLKSVRAWAESLKTNVYALYLCSRDRRVPRPARLMIVLVVSYALSPIDLIPDFIPVLGYLDDLVLLPLGIWLALRLVPEEIWIANQQRAPAASDRLQHRYWIAVQRVVVWL
ncbi:MAG: DUF1232 domain-containing protein, partial [Pseudomonadales bacterium]|nr:DUF1232 domain-containing protein [Pseudomonadales bacterium]